MKVFIKRDANGIHVGVIPTGASEYLWFTNNDGPGQVWDEVMKDYIAQSLENHVRNDRERLYEMGWRDAKSKKTTKKTEFNTCFNDTTDGAW